MGKKTRIEIQKIEFENGDSSYYTDRDYSPYSKIKREWKQSIEIDEDDFIEEKEFELRYCDKCVQMINHDEDGNCLKCKK